MPIATLVVAGNEADDGLYLPSIERAREVVGHGGQLYIGDSKMAALGTRATLAEAEDFYLAPEGPSPRRADRLRELLEPVWNYQQGVEPILAPALDQDQEVAQARGLVAAGSTNGERIWRPRGSR